MSDDMLTTALARAESAVARLEKVVTRRASTRSELSEAYTMLERRHAALRAQVQETIDSLDRLIDDEDDA
jgi:septal ring factor EnvC (AmiA/AmiB activator)